MKNIKFYFFISSLAFFLSITESVSAMQMTSTYRIKQASVTAQLRALLNRAVSTTSRPRIPSTVPNGQSSSSKLKLMTNTLKTLTLKRTFQQAVLPLIASLKGTTIDLTIKNKIPESLKVYSSSNTLECLYNNIPSFLRQFRNANHGLCPAPAIDRLSSPIQLPGIVSPNDEYKAEVANDNLEIIVSRYKDGSWHPLNSLKFGQVLTTFKFSPDSTLLGIGCKDGTLTVYDVTQQKKTVLKLTNFVDDYICKLSFSADNRFILVSCSSAKTCLIQYEAEKQNGLKEKQILGSHYKTQGGFAPDGDYLAAQTFCNRVGKNIGIWQRDFNTDQWSIDTQIPIKDTCEKLVFSPDGLYLAASINCQDGAKNEYRIDIWKKQRQEWIKIREILIPGLIHDITFSEKTRLPDKPMLFGCACEFPIYYGNLSPVHACVFDIENGVECFRALSNICSPKQLQLNQNCCVFDNKIYALQPPINYLLCVEAFYNINKTNRNAVQELQALEDSETLQALPEPYKAHLIELIDAKINQLTRYKYESQSSNYYSNKKLFCMGLFAGMIIHPLIWRALGSSFMPRLIQEYSPQIALASMPILPWIFFYMIDKQEKIDPLQAHINAFVHSVSSHCGQFLAITAINLLYQKFKRPSGKFIRWLKNTAFFA